VDRAAATTGSGRGVVRLRSRRTGVPAPWWFLLPALALYAFVVLVPTAEGAWFSLTSWDGISPVKEFVGLDNFRALLDDEAARASIRQTVLIAVGITVIQNGVGLLLALGVDSAIKSRNILRVFLFAPAVLTPVVIAFLWQYMYAPDGAINSLLAATGLGALEQDWLGNPSLTLWAVVAVVVWQYAGYSMVIFLAGLQSIPAEIYEAAAVDGAGAIRRFWDVIRPLLAPAITINLMLSIIGGLKLFDQVWVMTGGGPGHATETLSTLIYKDAFQFGQFGYSAALALVLTAFVAIVSGAQYRILRRQEIAG
jgi:raffinose/stachyose/melibiose transport system permease protein